MASVECIRSCRRASAQARDSNASLADVAVLRPRQSIRSGGSRRSPTVPCRPFAKRVVSGDAGRRRLSVAATHATGASVCRQPEPSLRANLTNRHRLAHLADASDRGGLNRVGDVAHRSSRSGERPLRTTAALQTEYATAGRICVVRQFCTPTWRKGLDHDSSPASNQCASSFRARTSRYS